MVLANHQLWADDGDDAKINMTGGKRPDRSVAEMMKHQVKAAVGQSNGERPQSDDGLADLRAIQGYSNKRLCFGIPADDTGSKLLPV